MGCPVWTVRTTLAFGIINALLVRTADHAIGNHHRPNLVVGDEPGDLTVDRSIQTDIDLFREPPLQESDIRALLEDDTNRDFRG